MSLGRRPKNERAIFQMKDHRLVLDILKPWKKAPTIVTFGECTSFFCGNKSRSSFAKIMNPFPAFSWTQPPCPFYLPSWNSCFSTERQVVKGWMDCEVWLKFNASRNLPFLKGLAKLERQKFSSKQLMNFKKNLIRGCNQFYSNSLLVATHLHHT